MSGLFFWGHTQDGCRLPDHSQREWEIIIIACGYRCFYCSTPLLPQEATKDHLIPLFRSGCNCRGNLVAACGRCNSMKKEKTIYEFLQMRPAFERTTGKFYTSIHSLEPVTDLSHDPLLNAVKRLAEKKAFPNFPSYREPDQPSWAWRNSARRMP